MDHSVAPRRSSRWGRVTWVKSQWKLRANPGQFWVEINTVTFQVADAEALPFADAGFDFVLSTFGVMFAPHHEKAA
ncbi:MAG TPA: class I SAM-dependent methyltransferase, partial [Ottowia sp.]|uniref:class I SAM-dependent methyltransferase n=1 Tax=Ottowia sp. TaxID=1898956 RepID=UPI002BC40FC0